MKKQKLFQRIIAKTPEKNRKNATLLGTLGTISGAILATGLIVNPIGIIVLTALTAVGIPGAIYNGQKVEK